MSVAQQPIPGFPHLTMPAGYNSVSDFIAVLKINCKIALDLSTSARTEAQRAHYRKLYDRDQQTLNELTARR